MPAVEQPNNGTEEFDSSEEDDTDDSDTEEEPCWSVCELRDGSVQCQNFFTEAQARVRFEATIDVSKVLFNTCGTAVDFFATNGYDAAQILLAYQSGETPDRNMVIEAVNSGDEPFVPPERSKFKQWCLQFVMRATFSRRTVRYFGASPLRNTSLCFFDVKRYPAVQNHVALTIDDAPCRFGRENSRLGEVLALLHRHKARATFMTIGKFVNGHEDDMIKLLRAGHEIANHGMLDRPYHEDTPEEFSRAVDECNAIICDLQKNARIPDGVRWFRAPHGKYTREMEAVLQERSMTNMMCDTYASCPVVQDGEWIGEFLATNARHGSVILLHMPEVGHREWCLTGLQRLLEGLESKGFTVVTANELDRLAQSQDLQAERQHRLEERRRLRHDAKLAKAQEKTQAREERFLRQEARRQAKMEKKQQRRQAKAENRNEKKRRDVQGARTSRASSL